MGLRGDCRDGLVRAAEDRVPRQADAGRPSLAAWDAWGAVRRGATVVARRAPLTDADAEKLADQELDVQEQDAWGLRSHRVLREVALRVAAALCKPDAGRFAAQSFAVHGLRAEATQLDAARKAELAAALQPANS
jgi:hypothetical protein